MSLKTIITFQGLYYVVIAIWPLVHIKSFEFVTGPKKENWLVYTVSVLLIAYSGTIFYGMTKTDFPSPELVTLSMLNAIGLTCIDVIFVMKKTIRKFILETPLSRYFLLF
jgi:hypothetical protein